MLSFETNGHNIGLRRLRNVNRASTGAAFVAVQLDLRLLFNSLRRWMFNNKLTTFGYLQFIVLHNNVLSMLVLVRFYLLVLRLLSF